MQRDKPHLRPASYVAGGSVPQLLMLKCRQIPCQVSKSVHRGGEEEEKSTCISYQPLSKFQWSQHVSERKWHEQGLSLTLHTALSSLHGSLCADQSPTSPFFSPLSSLLPSIVTYNDADSRQLPPVAVVEGKSHALPPQIGINGPTPAQGNKQQGNIT